MSAAGKASGSRDTRIAMYCAVHSPTPGSWRSRGWLHRDSRSKRGGRNRSRPQPQARTGPAARAFGMPSAARFTRASRDGRGKTCVSPAVANRGYQRIAVLHDEAAGERACAAHRDFSPTENGADRESSKPSQAPGTLNPGRASTRGASTASSTSCSAMACGLAPRSNTRRSRAMIAGSFESLGKAISARSAFPGARPHRDCAVQPVDLDCSLGIRRARRPRDPGWHAPRGTRAWPGQSMAADTGAGW